MVHWTRSQGRDREMQEMVQRDRDTLLKKNIKAQGYRKRKRDILTKRSEINAKRKFRFMYNYVAVRYTLEIYLQNG